MTQAQVRPAAAGDGRGCAEVWIDTGHYYSTLDPRIFQIPSSDGLADAFERDLADAVPGQLYLVAEVDGAVVGFLVAVLQEPAPHPERQLLRDLSHRRLFVQILAVAGPHRRAGVGTALMTGAEEWARDHDAAMVSLDTYLHSPTSVPFYENRMGYTRRAIVFRKELEPGPPPAPSAGAEAVVT